MEWVERTERERMSEIEKIHHQMNNTKNKRKDGNKNTFSRVIPICGNLANHNSRPGWWLSAYKRGHDVYPYPLAG